MVTNRKARAPLSLRVIRCESGIAAIEFAFLAPIVMALLFGTVTYSLYFATVLGVRHAAAEGARAAVAGLSTQDRHDLALARTNAVLSGYGPLIQGQPPILDVSAEAEPGGLFRVRVTYDMSGNSIMRYGAFLPTPSSTIDASVVV
ncbi:MAG: TadE-like protein, partial [Rhizorhabdus sp.]|nr:TadE-like protein [Rhizorhabdus sp.]